MGSVGARYEDTAGNGDYVLDMAPGCSHEVVG